MAAAATPLLLAFALNVSSSCSEGRAAVSKLIDGTATEGLARLQPWTPNLVTRILRDFSAATLNVTCRKEESSVYARYNDSLKELNLGPKARKDEPAARRAIFHELLHLARLETVQDHNDAKKMRRGLWHYDRVYSCTALAYPDPNQPSTSQSCQVCVTANDPDSIPRCKQTFR